MSAAHGTQERYDAGCRCAACSDGVKVLKEIHDFNVRASVQANQIPHGLRGFDEFGCRCKVCTKAKGYKRPPKDKR